MKLRSKIILLATLPAILLGVLVYFIASYQITKGIETEAYAGLQATVLSIGNIFERASDGEYRIDENGILWKGDNLNISEALDIVDDIKKQTGFDVTVFYGDTRYLTSITNESGARQTGTKASDKVIQQVLNSGKEYYNNNTDILGERYICYYIPLKQSNSNEVVGMIFLGEKYSNVQGITSKATIELLISEILVLILAVVVSALYAKALVSAIDDGIEFVDRLKEGKLGAKMPQGLLTRKDAIGRMCRNIDALDGSLRNIMTGVKDHSNTLDEAARVCFTTIQKVLDSVEQIDKAIQEIAVTAGSQAQDAVMAGESVNVMGQMVENTSDNVDELSAVAGSMAQASSDAKSILNELNTSMVSVKKSVDIVFEQTNHTHDSVEQVSQMTEVITEIASQTNLLSLNASIEAARAGEQGRGFAVVATEIQKLAEQCNQAAVEIQKILEKLKADSEDSVSTMNDVREMIQVQEDKINNTNNVFETVDIDINQSVQGIDKISDSAKVLEQARNKTVGVVENMAAIAQENAASTQETAASVDEVTTMILKLKQKSQELQEIAKGLNIEVSIFTIE